jgi:hypothetical protein
MPDNNKGIVLQVWYIPLHKGICMQIENNNLEEYLLT